MNQTQAKQGTHYLKQGSNIVRMEGQRQEDDREQAQAITGQHQALDPSTPATPEAKLWRSASAILRGPPWA
eukprot:11030002-Karenia_brevis.AAC.1